MATLLDNLEWEMADYIQWVNRAVKAGGGSADEKVYLKDRLAKLEGLEIRFGNSKSDEDRRTMVVVRSMQRKLEKQIYPAFIPRLLYRTFKALIVRNQIARAVKSSSENLQVVNTQLNRLGFDGAKAEVERNMKVGNRDFSVPISHFVSETERVEYKLHYTRTDGNGYDLARFEAIYIAGNNQPIVSSFKGGDIDAKQAFNLLAGRSVEMPDRSWMQLDFNDRDAEGNFKTKVFPASLGYDINLAIEKLKNSTGIDLAHIQGLVQALKNGDIVRVQHEETKQVIEVAANPMKKELTVYADGVKQINQQQPQRSVSQKGPEQTMEKEVVTKGKSRGVRS